MAIADNSAVGTGVTVTETSGSLGQLQVNGGSSLDTLTVNDGGAGGLITLPGGVTFNGYSASNTLKIQGGGGAGYADTYTAGPATGAGKDVLVNGGSTQTVYFQNLAPVIDTVAAGSLTVNGNNANNAISYTQGPNGAAYGLVGVDSYETIEFQNKTALLINGQGGSDTISLHDSNTPTGLTGITVDGGDPTSGTSDVLMVNGTAAATIDTSASTIVGAGPVTITYQNVEQVDFDGTSAGESLTVKGTAGNNTVVITPGAAVDAGTVVVNSLTPIAFQNLGATGSLTINGNGGSDTLQYNGFAGNDAFTVGLTGTVGLLNLFGTHVSTFVTGVQGLQINTLGGEDTIGITVDDTYTSGISVQGDTEDNVLTYTAPANGITNVHLGSQTITTTGDETVTYTGLKKIAEVSSGAASTLTVTGSTSPENLDYTPTGTNAGTVVPDVGAFVMFSGVGSTFTINGLGADTLSVEGTSLSDAITVNGTASTVQVNALETVAYTGIEWLQVNGNGGSDTFNVTTSATVPIFIVGGDPIGVLPGDTLKLTVGAGNAVSFNIGPTSDSGGFQVYNGGTHTMNATLSFTNIETIGPITGGPGSSAVVMGTNGNDNITVTAADNATDPGSGANGVQDFAVSVDASPRILYLGFANLYLDGLNGSDQFNLSTPAPTLADAAWDVQTWVGGGPGTSDKLVIQTPVISNVTYTPTGAQTGTFTLNQAAPSVITIGGLSSGAIAGTLIAFGDPNPSPEGVSTLVYDGESDNDTMTVTGAGAFSYKPGSQIDSGTLALGSDLPLNFQQLGATGTVIVDRTAASSLTVYGTGFDDTFNVGDAGGVAGFVQTVQINSQLPINDNLTTTDSLVLYGDGAMDPVVANITGNGLADLLVSNFGNNLGNDFGSSTPAVVSGGGLVPTTLSGVGIANITADGANITVDGTTGPDSFTVTPTDNNSATITNNTTSPQLNTTDGATLTIDPLAGNDTVTVVGTSVGNTVNVVNNAATTTVGIVGFQTVGVVTGHTEALVVQGGLGSDTINVSGTGGPSLTVNGGLPENGSGVQNGQPGDVLNITNTNNGATTVMPGATDTSGTITTPDGTTSFENIEMVNLTAAAAADTLLMDGTTGSDLIKLYNNGAANEADVNQQARVLFSVFGTVSLDGIAGNDTFNVTPVGLAGVSTVNVTGEYPNGSAAVIVNGTAGNDTITTTATGTTTATVQVGTFGAGNPVINLDPVRLADDQRHGRQRHVQPHQHRCSALGPDHPQRRRRQRHVPDRLLPGRRPAGRRRRFRHS